MTNETETEFKILPIYKIKGKLYFLDKRLNEYRNIKNPFDVLSYDEISLSDLQKPTEQDKKILEFNYNPKQNAQELINKLK